MSGIKAERTEIFVPFGVFYIHKPKLMNDNRLSLKYPSGACVRGFPSQIITDTLRNLLVKLIEDQKVDYKLLQSLSKTDSELFYSLIQKAKLDNQLGLSGYKDTEYQDQLKRFELLRGEILAGNNSPDIMKELKMLILNFMATSKMRKAEGLHVLAELDNLLSG